MTIGGAARANNSALENERREKEQMLKEATPAKYWVDSDRFNLLMIGLIILNSIIIGLETDLGREYPVFFSIVNDLFLFCYIAELTSRLFYHGSSFFKDGFNIFDAFLVGTALFEQFFFREAGGAGMFTVLRIIRLARLARMARLLRFIKELWLVVQGVGASLVTLGWVSLLLVTFCWVCAIFTSMGLGESQVWMFTEELVPKPYEEFDNEEYFGTVGTSCYTLFQVVTLSQWAPNVMRPILLKYPQQVLFFIFFIFMTTYGMMNIIVATLVQEAVMAAKKHSLATELMERIRKEKLVKKLDAYFTAIDTDESGVIDREEMERAMQKPNIIRAFMELDMPIASIHELMQSLDKDGNGEVTRHEFIEGIMRLRGESDPRETAKLILETQMMNSRIERLDERLVACTTKVKLVTRRLEVSFEKIAEMIHNFSKPGHDKAAAAERINKTVASLAGKPKLVLADAEEEGGSSDEDEKNRAGRGILRRLSPQCHLFIRNHRKIMGQTEATTDGGGMDEMMEGAYMMLPQDDSHHQGGRRPKTSEARQVSRSDGLGSFGTRGTRPGTTPGNLGNLFPFSKRGVATPGTAGLLPEAPNPARSYARKAQEAEAERRRQQEELYQKNRQSLRDFFVDASMHGIPKECPAKGRPKTAPNSSPNRRRSKSNALERPSTSAVTGNPQSF